MGFMLNNVLCYCFLYSMLQQPFKIELLFYLGQTLIKLTHLRLIELFYLFYLDTSVPKLGFLLRY